MNPTTPTAAAIIIGNEVLSGKIRDENTPYLVEALRSVGVALRRVTVVPDDADAIVEVVAEAHRRYDHVFTSGGIGPTHDDITVPCVAAALGRRLERNAEMERLLRLLYGDRLKEAHLRMATLPEGTELVTGGELMVPLVKVENIYVLPGVPQIFQQKILVLKPRLAAAPWHARYVYLLAGEGTLAPLLDRLVAEFTDVDVGSYPRLGSSGYRVKVTIESKDRARLLAALEAFLALVSPELVARVEDPAES